MLSAITRNAESKLTGWTWASTKTQAISYDANGQISAYNLGDPTTTGTRRTIVRDSAGRITGYTHVSNGVAVPALDQSFGYDNLNRLVSATLGATAIQYSYDATGNRTAKVVSGTSYPNTISVTSNKLTQTQDVGGTATVVHDAAGNITSDGANTYTYSDRGRLATMTNAGGTVTYSYNALEMRVGKTGPTALVPTGATYYVYDEEGKLLGEYDANGAPIYETIYMGMPVGMIKQTGTAAAGDIAVGLYNVSTDQLSAPRIITRQSDEAIAWRWDSAEAFGATAPDQNPSSLGTVSFNQRLPGQVFDAESGLFQNWNREYNPRIGRYMQSDPIGLAGGINTFAYVEGDPLGSLDRTGFYTEVTIWNGVGVGESQFGHISTNLNGKNYSWGPPGQWDSKYTNAADYNARQQEFRDGRGVILNLTPKQEKDLAVCLKQASGSYSVLSNNCGTSIQQCLQNVGIKFDPALRPNEVLESLKKSPQAIGNTVHPGPPRDGGALNNPLLWGF
jgi:RHS repeat-associated protein